MIRTDNYAWDLERLGGPAAPTEQPIDEAARAYARAGWKVFPLAGKRPLFECPISRSNRAKASPACPGDCGYDGHGVKDATADRFRVAEWWTEHPFANIGARVPAGLLVVDTDPRKGGEHNLLELGGYLPATMTSFSGRGDGGRHRYFLHPGGELSSRRLPEGVDLKTYRGYVVLPPSIHPDSRQPYRWAVPLLTPAAAPEWLVELLRPAVRPVVPRMWKPIRYTGDSVIAWFNATHDWSEILTGWTEVRGGWRHPKATTPLSATVRDGSLYVYSQNTVFEPTEEGDPHGYDKFAAWAELNHAGNLKEAARAAHRLRGDVAPPKRDDWIKELVA